jgi:hypothetical protein
MASRFKIHKKEWAIALLIILNLLTLGTLWLTVLHGPPSGPPFQRGGGAPDARDFLTRELGLNEAQTKEFDDLREGFMKAAGPIHEKIGRLKESLIGEMFRPGTDPARIKALIDEIGVRRGEEEKLLLAHFHSLVEACRPDQKDRFQAILRRFMTMIGALDPPELPRPGDGPERGPERGPGDGPDTNPGNRPPIR